MATNGNASINNRENASTLFYTNNAERMRIDSSGNVGIGTSSPSTVLHINDATDPILRLQRGGAAYSQLSSDSGGSLFIRADEGNTGASSRMQFDVDGSEAMRIDENGKLLIGAEGSNTVGGVAPALQVAGGGGSTSSISAARYQNGSSGSIIILHKSRGTTIGSQGLVADEDQVGRIDFSASDGVDGATVIAGMEARVDMGASGTAAADTLGGRLIWSVNRGTSGASDSDSMALTAAGQLIIGAGTATDPDANVLLEIAANNGGRAATSPLNTLRFRDTDTATTTNQPMGRIEWMTSDQTSGSANVGAYIEALATDVSPDTELVFATSAADVLSEAMRIDNNGNVGIGESSPSYPLHITTASGDAEMQLKTSGTGSGDHTIVRYAIGGTTASNYIYFGDSGDSNAGMLRYNHNDNSMSFTTNAAEAMRIDSSGHILFKVTALPATGVGGAAFENEANHGRSILQLGQTENTSTSRTLVEFYAGSSRNGTIQVNNSSTSYNTSSDHRLKENVEDMTGAITRVKLLSPKRFSWIVDEENNANVDGFLAHEAQTVVPEAVTGTHDGMRDEEYEVSAATGDIYTPATEEAEEVIHSSNVEQPETLEEGQQWRETTAAVMGTRTVPDYQGIDQSKLVPLLTAALQEAIAKIEALETRVAALEGA
tara:strand:- start:280 stop:2259 length:1980 start_codon:yes stop_codon:yes gene_type:complete